MASNIISPTEHHDDQLFINQIGHQLQCINRGSVGMPDNLGKIYKRYIIANYLRPLMKFSDYPNDNESYPKETLNNIIKNILTNNDQQISELVNQNYQQKKIITQLEVDSIMHHNTIDQQSNQIKQQEIQIRKQDGQQKIQEARITQQEIQSNRIKQMQIQINNKQKQLNSQENRLIQMGKLNIQIKQQNNIIDQQKETISQLKNETIEQNNKIDQQSDQIKQQEEMINQLLIALDEKNKTVTQSIIGLFK